MKRRAAFTVYLVIFVLPVVLSACSNKTALRFSNETQCGTATISITNRDTGNIQTYTVDEGKTVEATLTPGIEYYYVVTYQGQANLIACDTKKVTTRLDQGQTVTVRLKSVMDPALEQSLTLTPAATPHY